MKCPDCYDAARLRKAFYDATEEFQTMLPKSALPQGHPAIAIWAKLYEAVRDCQAGLGVSAAADGSNAARPQE